MTDTNTITIDDNAYDLNSLSEAAKAELISLQVVDRKIADAQQELAILQTARNAYAQAMAGQLPKTAHPNKKKDVVTIDGNKYALEDFSEEARATLTSLQYVTTQITQQQNSLAVLNTARRAYAQALKAQLPE
jgi:hypothetical protein